MVMTLITFKRDQTRSRSALVPTYNDGVILLLPHVDPGSHQIRVLRSDLQCHYTIKRSPIDYIAKQPPSHHYPQTTSESITNKMTEKSASFFEAAKVSHPAESPSRSQPPPFPRVKCDTSSKDPTSWNICWENPLTHSEPTNHLPTHRQVPLER